MLDIRNIKKVYFIGIGGIGMSALARYFRFHGKEVSGYDRTESGLTRQLIEEGISVHYEDRPESVPRDADLVVYTPAIPESHRELKFYQENRYRVLKRSDVLGLITGSSFNIAVAGTHGKTTITTMIAHILRDSGYGCNAFLGGIAVNYDSNYWSSERNVCVLEADEYDRSFLKLSPDIALITAMDADHLDIYGTAEAVEEAFIAFAAKLKTGGWLLSKKGLKREKELSGNRHLTYSLHDSQSDAHASDIRIENGSYTFNVIVRDWTMKDCVLHMGGLHNVENATAAIAVAHVLGIDDAKIRQAIANFRGVRRRFEYVLKRKGLIFIDDYAHHPEELKALIGGARGLFPNMRCLVIFQPHLFSRTRDLADGFAESLDMADEVILLPIYPARELPMSGVSSEMIANRMKRANVKLVSKEALLASIEAGHEDLDNCLFITAGAGDIDSLVQPLKEILQTK